MSHSICACRRSNSNSLGWGARTASVDLGALVAGTSDSSLSLASSSSLISGTTCSGTTGADIFRLQDKARHWLKWAGHVERMADEKLAEIRFPGSGGKVEARKTKNTMGGLC